MHSMNETILLLDFGASRIKAALYDIENKVFLCEYDEITPAPVFGTDGSVEIPANTYRIALFTLLKNFEKNFHRPKEIYLATEMGGFLLADANGKPITQYISWRDERAERSGVLSRLKSNDQEFRKITGMRLKPGIPFATLAYFAEKIPQRSYFLSLPEWILLSCGTHLRAVDETIAAASGLYDIEKRCWSEFLLDQLRTLGVPEFKRNLIEKDFSPIGYLPLWGGNVPVFGGIGDLQAAMLGAEINDQVLCINLGTGSQVNAILSCDKINARAEFRPFFNERRLVTVSHIPAGRALRVFEQFFSAISHDPNTFWKIVENLSVEEVLKAPIQLDLNLFATAWHWNGKGGKIFGITETNFTPRHIIASIVRSFTEQYSEAVSIVDPDRRIPMVRLAGGLARRIPILHDVFASILG